jgi:hypothetical protein
LRPIRLKQEPNRPDGELILSGSEVRLLAPPIVDFGDEFVINPHLQKWRWSGG